jgi:hypothetical protein
MKSPTGKLNPALEYLVFGVAFEESPAETFVDVVLAPLLDGFKK